MRINKLINKIVSKRIVLTNTSKKGKDFLLKIEQIKKDMLESLRATNLATKQQNHNRNNNK